MNLQNRLEKLEAKAGTSRDKITAIFRLIISAVDGKPKQLPIAGWCIEGDKKVMRLKGESNEILQDRAVAIARLKAGEDKAVRLVQIADDFIKGELL